MALSLSPHQATYASLLSNKPHQSCSTPRPFTTTVHGNKANDEILSMSQTTPPSLSSGFEHVTHNGDMNKLATPSQSVPPDLPSWTPLRTLDDGEGSSGSEQEVDELSSRRAANSEMKRRARSPTNVRPTAEVTANATRRLSSTTEPARKRARFDSVYIARKPVPYKRPNAHTQQARKVSTSSVGSSSLVDALSRTFNANRYSESPFPSRAGIKSRVDASTDVETTEDELHLNTRLAPASPKRKRTHARIAPISVRASETNSEDTASLPPDHPQLERPVKRLKAVQYEANAAAIDAALGTVQAPISWEAEMDVITREDDYVPPVQALTVRGGPPVDGDVPMAGDGGDRAADVDAGAADAPSIAASAPTQMYENPWVPPRKTVLYPYVSRGAKFRQRLEATFGANATVRTDKVARPRPADLELIMTLDEPEREPSPSPSDSSPSPSPSVAVTSGVPSTHIKSQSPDVTVPPVESIGTSLVAQEDQMQIWIVALQRLIKGKVRVNEEDLETLSIILAEIESLKDGLDQSLSMTTELRENLKQLSELHEIPFGDRNKLRLRAADIFNAWPPVEKPGAF